jgi:hypothetical protein
MDPAMRLNCVANHAPGVNLVEARERPSGWRSIRGIKGSSERAQRGRDGGGTRRHQGRRRRPADDKYFAAAIDGLELAARVRSAVYTEMCSRRARAMGMFGQK